MTQSTGIRACGALALAGFLIVADAWAQSAKTEGTPEKSAAAVAKPDGVAQISVSFKMDPRLAGGTYGGERWISPPKFTGAAAQDTVQARVEGTDAKGRPVKVSPKWTAADPEMVQITPNEGDTVSIKVTRPGTTTVALAAPGVTKELAVKAELRGQAMLVQITQ